MPGVSANEANSLNYVLGPRTSHIQEQVLWDRYCLFVCLVVYVLLTSKYHTLSTLISTVCLSHFVSDAA